MNTFVRTVSFLAACFFTPLTVFMIGDRMGAGFRFSLFLYQDTTYGVSLIPVWREISYVTSGIITGRSALSIILWLCGTFLLIAAIIYFAAKRQEDYESFRKPLALLVGGAGGAYLLSCILQYGPTLHGPAGLSVPVGVPLILAVAWYILRAEDDEDEYNEEDDCGEEAGEEE
ncbi:hypothetical protein [Methanoculleus sp. UBA291]|uniref:hypothetical protein n=1 Tax=Methanoculleus sp. UBA291 TaxID=1915495 RepID=UPI00316ABDEE